MLPLYAVSEEFYHFASFTSIFYVAKENQVHWFVIYFLLRAEFRETRWIICGYDNVIFLDIEEYYRFPTFTLITRIQKLLYH